MVFIALPALQRSQRNTQRKNDLSRFVTAFTQYQANNNNKIPIPAGTEFQKGHAFVDRYIIANGGDEQFQDPDGTPYTIYAGYSASTTFNCKTKCRSAFLKDDGTLSDWASYSGNYRVVNLYTHAKCSSEEGYVDWSSGSNDFVLMMALEGGSIACADNQ